MTFSITKLIGVDYLLNIIAAILYATGCHLFGSRSVCNEMKPRTDHDDTAAADTIPVVPVSGNGHQVPIMAPSRSLASANVTSSNRLFGSRSVYNGMKSRTDDDSVEDVTPLHGMTPPVSGNFHQVRERPSLPPLNNPKPILILDMDQTLIQAYKADAKELAKLRMSGYDTNQVLRFIAMGCTFIVFKRPGVEEFLQEMAKHYELVLWTAALQAYAEPIVNWLDPEKVIFSKRMYRTECTELPGGHYIKDLTRLGVDLSRVLIHDNNETCYAFQPANGVPISDFRGNNLDTEFLGGTYVSILRDASKLHDVRHGITDEFRHCVKHTSLFMSVRSIICAFCTLSYFINLPVLLIVMDLLTKFYNSFSIFVNSILYNSIQSNSIPFFRIRFKLVIEETQYETT